MRRLTTYKNPSLATQLGNAETLEELDARYVTIYQWNKEGKITLGNKTKKLLMKTYERRKAELSRQATQF